MTLLLSIPIRLGIDPIASSFAFGIVFAGVCLLPIVLQLFWKRQARHTVRRSARKQPHLRAYATGGPRPRCRPASCVHRLIRLQVVAPRGMAPVDVRSGVSLALRLCLLARTRPSAGSILLAVMLALLKSPRAAQSLPAQLPWFCLALQWHWDMLGETGLYGDLRPIPTTQRSLAVRPWLAAASYVWYFWAVTDGFHSWRWPRTSGKSEVARDGCSC